MNTINTQNKIGTINPYQTIATTPNASKNQGATKLDSYVKSPATSLVPETYSAEDIKNSAKTDAIKDIDLKSLTEDQYEYYFGFEIDQNGKTTYLPIIHASEDVQKAWIATMDSMTREDAGDMKQAMGLGCPSFMETRDSSVGKSMSGYDFVKSLDIVIQETLSDKYIYFSEGPYIGGMNDGRKEYADRIQSFLDLFKENYNKYGK